jgi:hypothetical protein
MSTDWRVNMTSFYFLYIWSISFRISETLQVRSEYLFAITGAYPLRQGELLRRHHRKSIIFYG